MKFHADHEFTGITLAEYERLHFDEEFNIALCKAVKLARTLKELTREGGHIHRVVTVGPDREIPKPAAKVLGAQRIEYTETVDYELGSGEGVFTVVSSLMTDKVKTGGTIAFRETPRGVRRIVDGEVTVKIFGVGKIVEKFIAAETEKSYDEAAEFTQKWIDTH